MKIFLKFITLILLSNYVVGQEKHIMWNDILITNKLTEKSVKLGAPVDSLKIFGEVISIDSLDQRNWHDDVSNRYNFRYISFIMTAKNTISTFETKSSEIAIEVKGAFSISVGDKYEKITALFPILTQNDEVRFIDREKKTYIVTGFYLSTVSSYDNETILTCDEGISILVNPETKLIEKISYFIVP